MKLDTNLLGTFHPALEIPHDSFSVRKKSNFSAQKGELIRSPKIFEAPRASNEKKTCVEEILEPSFSKSRNL